MQNLFIIYSSKNLEEDLKRLDDNAKVIAKS